MDQVNFQQSGLGAAAAQSNAGAVNITGVVKKSGKITGYRLSDGRSVTKEQGVQMARNGEIQGVGVATNQGTEYLRALPDGNEANNLSNLPTITN